MAGATESADIAAGHLAVHGDPLAARRAGLAHLDRTIAQADQVIGDALRNRHAHR